MSDPEDQLHAAAMAAITELMKLDPELDSPLGQVLDQLVEAVQSYEAQHFPIYAQCDGRHGGKVCEDPYCYLLHRPVDPGTPMNPWQAAVDGALVAHGLDCTGPDTNPIVALSLLMRVSEQMLLDPTISEQAQALIEQGRAQGRTESQGG